MALSGWNVANNDLIFEPVRFLPPDILFNDPLMKIHYRIIWEESSFLVFAAFSIRFSIQYIRTRLKGPFIFVKIIHALLSNFIYKDQVTNSWAIKNLSWIVWLRYWLQMDLKFQFPNKLKTNIQIGSDLEVLVYKVNLHYQM